MRRWVIRLSIVLAAILVLGGVVASGYFYALKKGWILFNEYDIRSEGTLRVGDLAPDLVLESADGNGPQKLSDLFREKPLVLVFGSYT